MKKDFSSVRLCVLVSSQTGSLAFDKLVREVVAGGADCVQLREKDLPDGQLLELARACRDICGQTIFIVNDRPDIAILSRADGVHVGQGDLPCGAARQIAGEDLLVGVSAASGTEVAAAQEAGADYVGVGCVFPTATKDVRDQGLGLVRSAAHIARVPCVAIGGINLQNVADVVRAGADAVAVCSAVISSRDPRGMARAIRERVLSARDERSRV